MLLAFGHALVFAAVYWLAFLLRFDFKLSGQEAGFAKISLPAVVGLKVLVFFLLGHYRGWWRYVTFADLVALIHASLVSLLLIVVAGYFASSRIPRSVLIIDCLLTIALLGSLRSSWRIFREHFCTAKRTNCRKTLLVGTDEASGVLAHQIQSRPELPYLICGLLETNGRASAGQLGQIPILGHIDDIVEVSAACGTTEVLVMADVLPGKRLRALVNDCRGAGLELKIIPAFESRLVGDARIPIRQIEINDLLRRDPVVLDTAAIGTLLEGRTVMVTGGGGSIGSEICRQVLKFHPRSSCLSAAARTASSTSSVSSALR